MARTRLWGHMVKYAETGRWWKTCSVTYTTLAVSPVPVPPVSVGPSPVAKLSFDSLFKAWVSSASASTEVAAVEGLFGALDK